MLEIIDHKGRKSHWGTVTDGTRFAYFQKEDSGFFSVNTVHQANRQTGTGFHLFDVELHDLEKALMQAMYVFAPSWATERDKKSTKKYENLEQYLNYEKKFFDDVRLIPFDTSKL